MKNLGYYNGKTGLINELSVPLTDRAFYFGDGVYDAVMCRNNIPYLLWEHIDRLYKNCQILGIVPPMCKNELSLTIKELVQKVEGEEKFVYFQVSRGSGIRNHSFTEGEGNLCIMIKPQPLDNVYEKMDTVLKEDIRYELCYIKTLNLLPSVLTAQAATEKGCEEAILHRGSIVTECSHSNVSILKNGTLITAPCDKYILPGVTRAHLITAAYENGIEVKEEKYTVKDLYEADEIIVTSSSKMARGVKTIDGKAVGGKDENTLSVLRDTLYANYLNATNK
ncbi:MAG: aminotransferase class IV [Clostridia bacterium]|nr:aminotransferase class IV [Clostridia bacterium]